MKYVWTTGKRFWYSIFYIWLPKSITKEFTIFLHQVVQDPPSTARLSACYRHRDSCPRTWRFKQRHNSNADICRKAVDNEFSTVDIPQNSMVGQQRQQISKLQFFRTPHFSCWIIRFKNEATTCSEFCIGNYVLDQRSGDGLFIGRIEISAISLWKGFSKLGDAGREDCHFSEEDHPEFPSRRKSASRSRKPRKRTGFYEETWCDVSMSRCLQICLPGKCWEITSWWKQGSFAQSSKTWTNLWDKNIKWDLLTIVSKNFSIKLVLKDWNLRTHGTEILSLEENNLVCEKNHRWRKRLVPKCKRKWWDTTKTHFSVAKNARTDEFSSVAILAPELSRSKWVLWQYQTTCFTVPCWFLVPCVYTFLLWPHVSIACCWYIWHTGS